MQVTIEIPDNLAKGFSRNEQERIIKEALEERLKAKKSVKNEPFFRWALAERANDGETREDVSANHDQYLYGGKV